jgi:hypothetical protein
MELDTGRDEVSSRMSDAHSHIRHLKHRWDLEDAAWEHLGDQSLRRSARLMFEASAQHLLLDLTIEGVTVSYRNTPYRFTRGIEALIAVITSDVEEFITAQSQGTN